MRPCKDHLALEEGALPKAAELCIAIPGNVDKEHFILEKKPCYWCFSSSISKQLAGFWIGCVWDKESNTEGTGNQGAPPAF